MKPDYKLLMEIGVQYESDAQLLSSMSEKVAKLSQNQAELAEKLNALISKFRI